MEIIVEDINHKSKKIYTRNLKENGICLYLTFSMSNCKLIYIEYFDNCFRYIDDDEKIEFLDSIMKRYSTYPLFYITITEREFEKHISWLSENFMILSTNIYPVGYGNSNQYHTMLGNKHSKGYVDKMKKLLENKKS